MTDQQWSVTCARAEEFVLQLPEHCLDLIVTDPPYFRVKDEAWDRQWKTPDAYLSWLGELCQQWARVLKPNGSLYVFASPEMAARVECVIREQFTVLNRIRWKKEAGWHQRTKKEELRCFLSPWEEILFAEPFEANTTALGLSPYHAKCEELRGFIFEPIRAYLATEWKRAGLKFEQANEACGTATMAGHFFGQSQWCLPTAEHYAALQAYANRLGGEYLRKDYEELRKDYEELRRPFFLSAKVPFTDVWDFPTVASSPHKHPCEKPLALLEHIIRCSSRPGALVADFFCGSGSTGVAALRSGRRFLACEQDPLWAQRAHSWIAAEASQAHLFIPDSSALFTPPPPKPEQLSLLEGK